MDSTSSEKEGASMKIYASSTLFWGHSFEHICQQVKSANLAGIEIWVEQLQFQQWTIEEIQYFLNSYQLEATIHANSWDLNLCSLNAGIRKQSLREIEASIHIAKQLEVPSITVHPGKRTVNNRFGEIHERLMISTLHQLQELSLEYGVNISLELMEPVRKEMYCTSQKMNELLAHCNDSITTTFDVAHIPQHLSIVDELKTLKRIDKIHISDSTKSTYHVPLGKGELLLDANLWETIDALGVPVVLEGLDSSDSHDFFYDHLDYLQTPLLHLLRSCIHEFFSNQ